MVEVVRRRHPFWHKRVVEEIMAVIDVAVVVYDSVAGITRVVMAAKDGKNVRVVDQSPGIYIEQCVPGDDGTMLWWLGSRDGIPGVYKLPTAEALRSRWRSSRLVATYDDIPGLIQVERLHVVHNKPWLICYVSDGTTTKLVAWSPDGVVVEIPIAVGDVLNLAVASASNRVWAIKSGGLVTDPGNEQQVTLWSGTYHDLFLRVTFRRYSLSCDVIDFWSESDNGIEPRCVCEPTPRDGDAGEFPRSGGSEYGYYIVADSWAVYHLEDLLTLEEVRTPAQVVPGKVAQIDLPVSPLTTVPDLSWEGSSASGYARQIPSAECSPDTPMAGIDAILVDALANGQFPYIPPTDQQYYVALTGSPTATSCDVEYSSVAFRRQRCDGVWETHTLYPGPFEWRKTYLWINGVTAENRAVDISPYPYSFSVSRNRICYYAQGYLWIADGPSVSTKIDPVGELVLLADERYLWYVRSSDFRLFVYDLATAQEHMVYDSAVSATVRRAGKRAKL